MVPANTSSRSRRKTKAGATETSIPDVEIADIAFAKKSSYSKKVTSGRVTLGLPLRRAMEMMLDKGIIVDAWSKYSVLGVHLMDIEAEIHVRSLDTYVRYADGLGGTILGQVLAEEVVVAMKVEL